MLTSPTIIPYRFEHDRQTIEPDGTSRSNTDLNSFHAIESISGNLKLAAILNANEQVDHPHPSIDWQTRALQVKIHRQLTRAGILNLTIAFLFAITLLSMGLLIKQPPMTWIAIGYALGHAMSFSMALLSAKNQESQNFLTDPVSFLTVVNGNTFK